ncbi:MAG: glycosyltransferase family protein [Bacteroidales bacterium]|nr:glycosyltransferase family protein [Bacteroidales bacterium]MCM1147063.1 glycosyltransferase family protein [Bacteroidales bacterium]MCM1205804.1 glycosyltransferase family protein [Bacillota bacterium]MCM1509953.1 glycosyltransferase family protein [Clostridium sp.]
MITFIICSIHPDKAAAVEKNVRETIGLPCEFIIEDNRETGNGICNVYNRCAQRAIYDNLCFLHEDVVFHGTDWGMPVIDKLQEKETGVIGFMGSIYKSKAPSGWNVVPSINRSHFVQTKCGESRKSDEGTGTFRSCLILDGACLFVRREVWNANPFDEVSLSGFHCYDIDFSLQVAANGFRNYVCGAVWLEHLSEGNFSKSWADATLRLYLHKWTQPMLATGLSDEELHYIGQHSSYIEARCFYIFLKNQRHRKWNKEELGVLRPLLLDHLSQPVLFLKCLLYLL